MYTMPPSELGPDGGVQVAGGDTGGGVLGVVGGGSPHPPGGGDRGGGVLGVVAGVYEYTICTVPEPSEQICTCSLPEPDTVEVDRASSVSDTVPVPTQADRSLPAADRLMLCDAWADCSPKS